MKPENQTRIDALPEDVQAPVKLARTMLEKALQALSGDTCTDADVRAAMGRAHSASRNLKRACDALNVLKGGAA